MYINLNKYIFIPMYITYRQTGANAYKTQLYTCTQVKMYTNIGLQMHIYTVLRE